MKKYNLDLNYIGQKFNRLLITGQFIGEKHHKKANVICDCGSHKIVFLRDVLSSQIVSCGCYNKEPNPKRNGVKHEFKGEFKTISEWCRVLGFNRSALGKYLNREKTRTIETYAKFKNL